MSLKYTLWFSVVGLLIDAIVGASMSPKFGGIVDFDSLVNFLVSGIALLVVFGSIGFVFDLAVAQQIKAKKKKNEDAMRKSTAI